MTATTVPSTSVSRPALALIDLSQVTFRVEHEPPSRIPGTLPSLKVPATVKFFDADAYAWKPLSGIYAIRISEDIHGNREMTAWVYPEFFNGPPELLKRKPVESSPKE